MSQAIASPPAPAAQAAPPAVPSAPPSLFGNRSANHSTLMEAIFAEIDGPEEFGRSVARVYKTAVSEVVDSEVPQHKWAKIAGDYSKMIINGAEKVDVAKSGENLADLTPEQFGAMIAEQCVQRIANDQYFANVLLRAIRDRQPDLFAETLTMGEVPDPQPALIGPNLDDGNDDTDDWDEDP